MTFLLRTSFFLAVVAGSMVYLLNDYNSRRFSILNDEVNVILQTLVANTGFIDFKEKINPKDLSLREDDYRQMLSDLSFLGAFRYCNLDKDQVFTPNNLEFLYTFEGTCLFNRGHAQMEFHFSYDETPTLQTMSISVGNKLSQIQ